MFLLIAFLLLVAIIMVVILIASYRVAGPNEALIVSGSGLGTKGVNTDSQGNKLKVVRGSGTFVMPVFQRARKLSLMSSALEVQTEEVYSANGVPITVDGTVMIKVGSSIQEIATAAEQYLDKKVGERENESREVLEGHLRAIIGTMTVEDLYKNRDEFAEKVQDQAATDLAKMGLAIISFTIKNISDTNGYLEALGKPQIARVQKEAAIAQAIADKETRINAAEAEQQAKQAEFERTTQIAEAQKINDMKMSAFKQEQDTARAVADQAYKIQEAKSMQETTEAEMAVELIKRQREVDLAKQEVLRTAQENEANIQKMADARKYEAEAQAQAEAQARKIKAAAEAEAIRETGRAEAEKLQAIGEAEAAAIEKKAEAMQKMNDAAKLNMVLEVLPQIAGATAENLKAIDSLNIYGGDGSSQIMGMSGDSLKQSLDMLGAMGINVPELMDNFSKRNNAEVVINNTSKGAADKEIINEVSSEIN